MAIQKDLMKANRQLHRNGNYEKKFGELNVEIKNAKEHYRKL